MSGSNSSDSNPSSPDLTEVDPNFSPDITDNNPITTPVVTRSQGRTKVKISPNHIINSIDLDQSINSQTNNPFNNTTMSELSLETAIKLIPCFNGQNEEDIYSFLNACEFAVSSVKDICKPTLVKAITTKLSGKAFAVTQNREIIDWAGLKSLLETAFCAKRTPGYLQLELNSTRQKPGEAVQEYSGRVEKLFHELCNVSVNGRKPVEAEAVRSYIKETTLTSYVEGLHQNLRQIVKSKNLISLKDDCSKTTIELTQILFKNTVVSVRKITTILHNVDLQKKTNIDRTQIKKGRILNQQVPYKNYHVLIVRQKVMKETTVLKKKEWKNVKRRINKTCQETDQDRVRRATTRARI